nr:MAG TPA: hypothetical protein [Caudoviricetes sp.]
MAVRKLQEMGENLQLIVKRLFANQTLLKLLYYTDKDPLSQPDITQEIIKTEIFEKLVKIVPRLNPYETAKSVIAFRVVKGSKLTTNDEFQNIAINFEVFVPLTQWILKSDSLRPFLIMSEIEKSLDGKTINGLGKMTTGGFGINFLTEEMSCYEIYFNITTYD